VSQERSSKQRLLTSAHAAPEVSFTAAEYSSRVARVRASMREGGIEVLYVSDPADLSYLCGYRAMWYQAHGHSGWGPTSGLAVHAEREQPLLFDTEKERVLIGHTTVGVDFRLLPRYDKPLMEFVLDHLRAEGWLGGTFALEMQSHRPYPSLSRAFQQRLEAEGATVLDGSDTVRRVRRRQSPAELECTRRAALIADAALGAGIAALRPGVSELELFGEMFRAMTRAGGDVPAMPPSVQSGPRTALARALPTRRTIVTGELVTMSAFGCFAGYHALLSGTAIAGADDGGLLETVGALERALRTVAEQARPGAAATELAAPEGGPEVIAHGLGLSLAPDAISDRYVVLGEQGSPAQDPLVEDEMLALTASMHVPWLGGCVRIGETVLVGAGETYRLSRSPAHASADAASPDG
jgi:Xaa-Pro aminopeptidase